MMRCPPPLQLILPLLIQVQYEDNACQNEGCSYDCKRYPWDPSPWPEEQLPSPCPITKGRVDDDARVWNDAFHIDKMFLCVLG